MSDDLDHTLMLGRIGQARLKLHAIKDPVNFGDKPEFTGAPREIAAKIANFAQRQPYLAIQISQQAVNVVDGISQQRWPSSWLSMDPLNVAASQHGAALLRRIVETHAEGVPMLQAIGLHEAALVKAADTCHWAEMYLAQLEAVGIQAQATRARA